MAVVEDGDGDDGAGVEHLPRVLLVPLRRQRVEQRPRAHPLGAVLGHAVGVRQPPLLRLHGHQVPRAQDAQLQDADGPLSQLLRRRLQVAAVVRGLVQHVVRRLQAQPQVDLARELLVLVAAAPRRRLVRRQRARQVQPLGLHRLGQVVAGHVRRRHRDDHAPHRLVAPRRHPLLHRHHQRLVERLPGHEHELLVPHRVGRPLRARPPDLPAHLDLGDGGRQRPALLGGEQVLRRDGHHLEVGELGRVVNLGARVVEPLERQRVRVRVPRLRERLVRLRAEPDGEHDLAVAQLIAAAVGEAVPLRRQRAVGREAVRDVGHVEDDAADEVVLEHVLVLDDDLQLVGLQVLAGEGEGLPPHRVGVLLQVLGHALEVAQLHLHVRVQRARHVHGREVARLHHAHVQVRHGFHHVVRRRDLRRRSSRRARAHLGRQRRLRLHQPVGRARRWRASRGWASGARHDDRLPGWRGWRGHGVKSRPPRLLLLVLVLLLLAASSSSSSS
uniref:Uncharacterized protein n=1 Tax=Arundo donax TaxID=35708 RepID=A0A0A9EK88_ARUDO